MTQSTSPTALSPASEDPTAPAPARAVPVKADSAFRTISEVADELGVQQHVLRFWETKFTQVKPLKRGGGRRYYRPEDVALLKKIHTLLYSEGYTIKGVQKLLKGVSKVQVLQEQKAAAAAQAFGQNMPHVQQGTVAAVVEDHGQGAMSAPKILSETASNVPLATASPLQAPSTMGTEQKLVLEAVLAELLDMRQQVRELTEAAAKAA